MPGVDVLATLSDTERELVTPAPPPRTAGAMKAVLTDERFSDPGWIFERKLDGIRCIAIRSRRHAHAPFAQRPQPERALPGTCRGPRSGDPPSSSRSTARSWRSRGRRPASPGWPSATSTTFRSSCTCSTCCGWRVTTSAHCRSARASGCSGARSSSTATSAGPNTATTTATQLFKEACRKGWEGLIAKRADSPYVTTRSRDWLKFKCEHGQELVIGGYTEPRGSRVEFGALLLGYLPGRAPRVRREGRHRVRHRHAPRARMRSCETSSARRPVRQSQPRSRSATSPGSSRASWPRSASPSGPATDACVTLASWDSEMTRRRRSVVREG